MVGLNMRLIYVYPITSQCFLRMYKQEYKIQLEVAARHSPLPAQESELV